MKSIGLNFAEDVVKINFPGQMGTECSPNLVEKRADTLEALGLERGLMPALMEIDFETEIVSLKFDNGSENQSVSIPELAVREDSVLTVLGYGRVDLSNSVALFEALINGTLPSGVIDKALAMEAQTNDADPVVTEFLKMVGLKGSPDADDGTEKK